MVLMLMAMQESEDGEWAERLLGMQDKLPENLQPAFKTVVGKLQKKPAPEQESPSDTPTAEQR